LFWYSRRLHSELQKRIWFFSPRPFYQLLKSHQVPMYFIMPKWIALELVNVLLL
jgi:hypothetical protein